MNGAERWIYTYNDLNQLTQRYHYSILWSSGGAGFVNKWVYTYDANGNVVVMSRQNVSSVQQDKWDYTWNPRDQMTKAEKRTRSSLPLWEGSREGENLHPYPSSPIKGEENMCCALSERNEYSPTVSTTITS